MRRLYVISDLHLGGRPDKRSASGKLEQAGYQICHSYGPLIDFINWISTSTEHEQDDVELVINGDIVDFLAEDDYKEGVKTEVWSASQNDAIHKLETAVNRARDCDRSVFDALRNLVKKRRLTLLLGNHDPELSLPKVRDRFIELLGGSNPRLRFIYDGEAYQVGRLLIEHGNRYDQWNQIDHSALRQERSVLSRNLPTDSSLRDDYFFIPPAGTHLVISFMNRIKRNYRFVDLLKPEDELVIPLLAALEPDKQLALDHIQKLAALGNEYRKHGMASVIQPKNSGDMGAGGPIGNLSTQERRAILGPEDEALEDAASANDMGAGSGLRAALDWVSNLPCEMMEALQSNSLLSALRIHGTAIPEKRLQILHRALFSILERDRSFALDRERPKYLDAARETARLGKFQAVIYGHTHLAKQIHETAEKNAFEKNGVKQSSVDFTYINTGTWADVMQFPVTLSGDLTQDRQALASFLLALKNNDLRPYIKRYLSYAEVGVNDANGDVLTPRLRCYGGKGKERAEPLTEYLGPRNMSEFDG